MHNSFFNFFISCITFSILILNGNLNAQNTSTSPYSSYGIGEIDGIDNATYLGIGNTTITHFDSTKLNYFNPSSYNTYAKGQPLFSIGASSRISIYNENGIQNIDRTITVNHFAMGFTFAKHFGVAFGLKPFTRRGYHFATTELLNGGTDSIKHTYIGTGSSSEAFLGFSTTLFKYKSHHLSIGGNLGFVFGTLKNERRSNLIGSTAGGIETKSTKLQSIHYEYGLNYRFDLNKKHSFILSGVLEPLQDLRATQRVDLYSSKNVDNESYYLKLDSLVSGVGSITLAPSSTIGLNYILSFNDVKNEGKIRNSEISFHTSYNISNWSRYTSKFDGTSLNPGYLNTSKFTFGLEYSPEKDFLGQTTKGNFLETVRYRVGCYQYTLPFSSDGIKQVDSGVTLGFGIPIRVQKSLSSLNIGFSAGQRGNGVSGALTENHYGINLGIIFAPASFERWFVKRKLD